MHNAIMIAATMNDVDRELLELAVLLHDVEQPAGRKRDHVQLSVRTAGLMLREAGCPIERATQVLEVIAQHSTEHVETVHPSSNEAKILFDADKLDGLGAVGIARVFSLFGQMGRIPFDAISWYREKISISLKHLQTEEGRRMFELRMRYVEEFLLQMEAEASESGMSSKW
jgi:uncharacterized protein